MDNILVFQSVACVLILLTGLVGGFVSFFVARSSRSQRFFSLGNAFGGGVFLGAGLIHLLPDAVDGFASIPRFTDYPVAVALCACGFVFVLLLEKVALTSHHAVVDAGRESSGVSIYPYIVTVVLSIHSLIAGIALGAEEVVVKAGIILVAIVAHKGSAAFALSVGLQRGGVAPRRHKAIVVLFCFMTPIGLILGATLRAQMTGAAEQVFESLFDALAAGTFLYVAAIDVIHEEFEDTKHRVSNAATLLIGLALMAVLALFL